ncbi:unnamed protein product [Brachionus calyciflorus]|uniref:FAS1 domain-containing protein n=1 Tax=Brachionus calyciflorus TaxID=104777 RepID=A0A813U251_9BILA|nr:unnamed protein product [Brachionus calyciflorus]
MKLKTQLFFLFFLALNFYECRKFGSKLKLKGELFKPKATVSVPTQEIEEDDDLELIQNEDINFEEDFSGSKKPFSSLEAYFFSNLANSILKPTDVYENIFKSSDVNEFPYDFIQNLTINSTRGSNINAPWKFNGNVCNSKTIYLKKLENYHEFSFDVNCDRGSESEVCVISFVSGSNNFTIYLTTSCCPNYKLNGDVCEKNEQGDELEELKENLDLINSTIRGYLKLSEIDFQNEAVQDFFKFFSDLYDNLIGDSSIKLTIFLWDNQKFIDKLNQYFNDDENEIDEILYKIKFLLNIHIVELHHQIFPNGFFYFVPKIFENKNLKFNILRLDNENHYFVNCKEIINYNNFFKKLSDEHEYQLLIHKLEPGSILESKAETLFDILQLKILETTQNFKIFKEIFNTISPQMYKKLTSLDSHKTVFIPTDRAFRNFTKNEIESIIFDDKCSTSLISQNIIDEYICPSQYHKLNADYTISTEKLYENFYLNQIYTYFPQLKVISKNFTKILFFNNQLVHLTKSSKAINGIVYGISDLNTYNLNLLSKLVNQFDKKISPSFKQALNNDLITFIRDNGNNSLLLLPGLKYYFKGHSIDKAISIEDYLFQPKFNLYQLKNGQILNSLSGRKYLINSVKTNRKSFELFKYLPEKYFESKFINCQEIEESQYSGCNSELAFFNSKMNYIPKLSQNSLLAYLKSDVDFYYFNSKCGRECVKFLTNLEKESNKSGKGYTLFLPINNFDHQNFATKLKSKVFNETLCEAILNTENFNVVNFLNETYTTTEVFRWIEKSQTYLSINGFLIHKTNWN